MNINSIKPTRNSFGALKVLRKVVENGKVVQRIVEDPMITQMKRFERLKKTPEGKNLSRYDLYPIAHQDYEKVRSSNGKYVIEGAAERKGRILSAYAKLQQARDAERAVHMEALSALPPSLRPMTI